MWLFYFIIVNTFMLKNKACMILIIICSALALTSV